MVRTRTGVASAVASSDHQEEVARKAEQLHAKMGLSHELAKQAGEFYTTVRMIERMILESTGKLQIPDWTADRLELFLDAIIDGMRIITASGTEQCNCCTTNQQEGVSYGKHRNTNFQSWI